MLCALVEVTDIFKEDIIFIFSVVGLSEHAAKKTRYDPSQQWRLLTASCQQTCMTYTIAVRTVKNS